MTEDEDERAWCRTWWWRWMWAWGSEGEGWAGKSSPLEEDAAAAAAAEVVGACPWVGVCGRDEDGEPGEGGEATSRLLVAPSASSAASLWGGTRDVGLG